MDNQALYLDEQLCFRLYATSRAMTKAYQPMLQALGITYPQYLVLMVLWEWWDDEEKDVSVKRLGERLYLDSGTLTPLLKRMEAADLVRRQRDDVDERKVLLYLTEAGLALRPKVLAWVSCEVETRSMDERLIQRLRDDLSSLLGELTK
ncbi:MAG: MarR family transcriptional regulator [Candidatus Pelagadaptatus aseana]|uniref:MarR family winged helix-turn-helix transcriptional regulator n=1 Tax=Candidatus Pelagadaptatus aseana TaxID=3120508 RepID=UPI0039B29124